MPVSQMRNGLTAENSIFSQKPNVNVKRSRFDYSRANFLTGSTGMIIPVDCWPTLPNEDYDLRVQYKIDFRPLVVPTLTSYKVKVHAYFCKNEDLWSGWETFISKGRSGNLALSVPTIDLKGLSATTAKLSGLTDPNFKSSDGSYFPYSPHSLLGYLYGNVPYYNAPVESDDPDGNGYDSLYLPFIDSSVSLVATGYKPIASNALPLLMYQKIYRSNYMDPNLMSNGIVKSDVWFPDDIDSTHWRFNYAASNLGGSYNAFFVPEGQEIPSSDIRANFVPKPYLASGSNTDGDNVINLTQLRYAMYTDDMFTTALPFLQRGPVTSLDADVADAILSMDALPTVTDFELHTNASTINNVINLSGTLGYDADKSVSAAEQHSLSFTPYVSQISGMGDVQPYFFVGKTTNDIVPTGSVSGLQVSFTAQQLRSLLALSVWQERNALTNGSYGQFIKVHFDSYPDNEFCEPIYIGGTTSVFDVNAVVQTSASESGSTPQGNQSGIGGSSNSQSLGSFHSKDFGFIMILLMIIPDTIYVQNTEHWQFDLEPNDYYMPEYEQLSYQPILNKMLYSTGDYGEENSVDDQPFGYSNRYVYLKYRESIARGLFALPASIDKYYHSYVQSRIFNTTPKLSQDFVTVYPPNIDRSYLAYPGQPEFLIQWATNVNVVKPLSYMSQPNTFGF